MYKIWKGALLHGNIIYNMLVKYMGPREHILMRVMCRVSKSINIQMNGVEYYTTLGMNELVTICIQNIYETMTLLNSTN